MTEEHVALLGATSLVGQQLLPQLTGDGYKVTAFTRNADFDRETEVTWRQLSTDPSPQPSPHRGEGVIPHWICVAPIWVLPAYLPLLKASGARRVVALSSTSRFTKEDSTDADERVVARRLAEGESRLQAWAEANGVEWVILRPTLIYGRGQDKNISEIARFISRYGFFPLFGQASGLRQPVNVEDVAQVCLSALESPVAANKGYNISGGETLSYRQMVERVFSALDRRPRLLKVPLSLFRLVVVLLRLLPRYRQWSAAMAERMNRDMVFDHSDAARDLGFSPRAFELRTDDLPSRDESLSDG